MTTSRTGTARHKRMATQVLNAAQEAGIYMCPSCKQPLDYLNRRAPNGAQADEIIPYGITGETSTDPGDWQVLCATCNRSKGNRVAPSTSVTRQYPQSRAW